MSLVVKNREAAAAARSTPAPVAAKCLTRNMTREAEANRKRARTLAKQQACERVASATTQLSAGINEAASEAAGRPCVLVVDDSVTMRRSIELTLQTGGYEVVTAADGTVALALLREGLRPDLLLTDIVMPGTDGRTLIREARKLLRFTPIVALTTQGAPEMRQQGRADGATAWLLKPTGGRGLLELVARFVQRAPQAPAA